MAWSVARERRTNSCSVVSGVDYTAEGTDVAQDDGPMDRLASRLGVASGVLLTLLEFPLTGWMPVMSPPTAQAAAELEARLGMLAARRPSRAPTGGSAEEAACSDRSLQVQLLTDAAQLGASASDAQVGAVPSPWRPLTKRSESVEGSRRSIRVWWHLKLDLAGGDVMKHAAECGSNGGESAVDPLLPTDEGPSIHPHLRMAEMRLVSLGVTRFDDGVVWSGGGLFDETGFPSRSCWTETPKLLE